MLFTVSFIFAFLQCVLTYNLTVACELRRKKLAVLLFLVKFAGYGGGIYLFIYKFLGYVVSVLGGFLAGLGIGFVLCLVYRIFFYQNGYALLLVFKSFYNKLKRFFKNQSKKRKMKKYKKLKSKKLK